MIGILTIFPEFIIKKDDRDPILPRDGFFFVPDDGRRRRPYKKKKKKTSFQLQFTF